MKRGREKSGGGTGRERRGRRKGRYWGTVRERERSGEREKGERESGRYWGTERERKEWRERRGREKAGDIGEQ